MREDKKCFMVGLGRGCGFLPSTLPPLEEIYHKTNLLPYLYRLIPAYHLPLGDFPFSLSFPPWYILFLLMVDFVFLA